MKLKYSCKFPDCKNSYYADILPSSSYKNKHFYRFPKKSNLLRQWKKICCLPDDANCDNIYVCEDHFLQKDFMNSSKHRLNRDVVPKNINNLEQSHAADHSYSNLISSSVINKDHCSSDVINVTENNGSLFDVTEESLSNNFPDEIQETDESTEHVGVSSSDTVEDTSISNFSGIFEQITERTKCEDISSVATSSDEFILDLLNHDDDKYNFLLVPLDFANIKVGVLGMGLSKPELTPKNSLMYKIHIDTISKLSKLQNTLRKKREQLKILDYLYNNNKFQFIHESLGKLSRNFINSHLKNATKKQPAERWTIEDKTLALSIYKRGPWLYKYLLVYFLLPSIRILKELLSKICFDTGLNTSVLSALKTEVSKMNEMDKYSVLIFDEMSLHNGLYYEGSKQQICGYQDLGHLGRSPEAANHALVFMVRGIRKQWKQITAYYFTANTISSDNLKIIIVEIISQLQKIGLHIVGTVCDQSPTNQKALHELCQKNLNKTSLFYFIVNDQPIVTIFDVPHLLRSTRSALISCKIIFDKNKEAKFQHIETVFNVDQQKTFKTLPKLKKEHFNYSDNYIKMNVKVAAAQLSRTVAAAIETFVITDFLPFEAIHTAEFVDNIDNLFDSLNGSLQHPVRDKMYRCALSGGSPHLIFWSKMLHQIRNWILIDIKTGKDVTNTFKFIEGWEITLRSVIFLWGRLKKTGFKYLNLKSFNQDPVQNLFCSIRQHSIPNTNPTCFQFISALKTTLVNNLATPLKNGNCEDDECIPLTTLSQFLTKNLCNPKIKFFDSLNLEIFSNISTEIISVDNSQGLSYILGYILKKVDVDEACQMCKTSLLADSILDKDLFTVLKKSENVSMHLTYASEAFIEYVKRIHNSLYKFLNEKGHTCNLEDNFKVIFSNNDKTQLCSSHALENSILDQVVPFLIYKYAKDNKEAANKQNFTISHEKKRKKFRTS